MSDNYVRLEKDSLRKTNSGFQSIQQMHMMVSICGFW